MYVTTSVADVQFAALCFTCVLCVIWLKVKQLNYSATRLRERELCREGMRTCLFAFLMQTDSQHC